MTRNEVDEGSVIDLLARIARERAEMQVDADQETEVVDAAIAEKSIQPPTRLFPGAPRRRRR